MILGQTALALIGLLLAAWAIMAAWFVFAARARVKRAENGLKSARRLARMVEESPAIPLLVRADGRIEASPRLARWLGLDTVPQFLTELGQNDGRGDANGRGNGGLKGEANANDGGEDGAGGIPSAQMAELAAAVRRTQKTGAAFRMVVTPAGFARRRGAGLGLRLFRKRGRTGRAQAGGDPRAGRFLRPGRPDRSRADAYVVS
jgi:hypothetical protein